jgi:hypothetical protein
MTTQPDKLVVSRAAWEWAKRYEGNRYLDEDLPTIIERAMNQAADAERERCAKVADRHHVGLRGIGPVGRSSVNTARIIAAAIRKGGRE